MRYTRLSFSWPKSPPKLVLAPPGCCPQAGGHPEVFPPGAGVKCPRWSPPLPPKVSPCAAPPFTHLPKPLSPLHRGMPLCSPLGTIQAAPGLFWCTHKDAHRARWQRCLCAGSGVFGSPVPWGLVDQSCAIQDLCCLAAPWGRDQLWAPGAGAGVPGCQLFYLVLGNLTQSWVSLSSPGNVEVPLSPHHIVVLAGGASCTSPCAEAMAWGHSAAPCDTSGGGTAGVNARCQAVPAAGATLPGKLFPMGFGSSRTDLSPISEH